MGQDLRAGRLEAVSGAEVSLSPAETAFRNFEQARDAELRSAMPQAFSRLSALRQAGSSALQDEPHRPEKKRKPRDGKRLSCYIDAVWKKPFVLRSKRPALPAEGIHLPLCPE